MKHMIYAFGLLFLTQCTNESQFNRSNRSKKKYNAEIEQDDAKGEATIDAAAESTRVTKNYSTVSESAFWLATTDGHIVRTVIDESADVKVDPKNTKVWDFQLLGGGGTRTYMLEGGSFILSRSGGYLVWVNKDTSNDSKITLATHPENYYELKRKDGSDINTQQRTCVVSYKRDNKRYLGVTYPSPGLECWICGNRT